MQVQDSPKSDYSTRHRQGPASVLTAFSLPRKENMDMPILWTTRQHFRGENVTPTHRYLGLSLPFLGPVGIIGRHTYGKKKKLGESSPLVKLPE